MEEFNLFIKELGDIIAKYRKESGFTQREFAQRIQVHQSVVAKIESGQNMTCSTLWKISQALNLPLTISFIQKSNPAPMGNCEADFNNEYKMVLEINKINEKLLEARERVLSLIPECPIHGFCLPHFESWIKNLIPKTP